MIRTAQSDKVLVVHAGGIGDFLLTCPALQGLCPPDALWLLGRRERLELAVDSGIAAGARDLDTVDFDSVFSRPSPVLRSFLAEFRQAVVWMKDDGTIRRAFREAGVDDVRAFSGRPPAAWRRHAAEYYTDCLGLRPPQPLRLDMGPCTTSLRDVVIHPGSGGRHKNWPLERFTAVADWLHHSARSVAWLVGPAEERLEQALPGPVIRNTPLRDLARILAAARLYIGNDSGITHLAAAVGCPTIAVFGPTPPNIWAPRGRNVRIIHATPWPETTQVIAGISEQIT